MPERMADESVTELKAADGRQRPVKVRMFPRWMLLANGRPYRLVMRLGHRFGWCYPQPAPVEPGFVWCHWCGMRGRR